MFVLIALLGILSLLLVVTASVAYLALPRGRLCPQCGGPTNPVVLRRLLRVLAFWIQWRWCARCGWEGPGLREPDLGELDPSADSYAGFRRGRRDPDAPEVPDIGSVPIFNWRSGPQEERREAPSDHPSGFKWQPEEKPSVPSEADHATGFKWQPEQEPTAPLEPEPSGFHFRPPGDRRRPQFTWGRGSNRGRRDADNPRPRRPRPWYLSWLVSKDPPGFQWKDRGD